MSEDFWTLEFPSAITVCDREGIILSMNQKACETFASEGGMSLIGTNLFACHPEPARTKLADMLESGSGNVYTIEKSGVRKLILQSPWYKDGKYAGFVEIAIPIPEAIPHFVRGSQP